MHTRNEKKARNRRHAQQKESDKHASGCLWQTKEEDPEKPFTHTAPPHLRLKREIKTNGERVALTPTPAPAPAIATRNVRTHCMCLCVLLFFFFTQFAQSTKTPPLLIITQYSMLIFLRFLPFILRSRILVVSICCLFSCFLFSVYFTSVVRISSYSFYILIFFLKNIHKVSSYECLCLANCQNVTMHALWLHCV